MLSSDAPENNAIPINNAIFGVNDGPTSRLEVHLLLYVARYLNWLDQICVQLFSPLISPWFILSSGNQMWHNMITYL